MSLHEIPLDKKLTANCLVEMRTKLEELILAAMVDYVFYIGYSSPSGCSSLCLMVSHAVWSVLGHSGQRTSIKCPEALWYYKVGGVVHHLFFCFVLFFI